MKIDMKESLYQIREFAERSGVTVRALHHYDHMELLKPAVYSESGYRLYSDHDFMRLQQIVTLKFLGFSLKQIKDLLDGDRLDLPAMLRLQRSIMEEKRRGLDRAIQSIARAEAIAAGGEEPGWDWFKQIIEAVIMEQSFERNKEWLESYYSKEQLESLAQRAAANPDEAVQGERDWAILIADVEAAIAEGVDPASERGQALAARWKEMIGRFTLGDPGLEQSLKTLYQNRDNWPADIKPPFSEEVGEFMAKAKAIHKGA